jgi:lysophospholipase
MLFDSELDTAALSRDPEVVRHYTEDPLVTQKVSARWYSEAIKAMKRAHRDAGTLATPMLLMQSGADRLVDPAEPARWAAVAPQGRVELVEWEGFFHEMFNEPEKDRVRHRALEWLNAQIRGPEPER